MRSLLLVRLVRSRVMKDALELFTTVSDVNTESDK